MSDAKLERKTLRLSLYANAGFVALALLFAVLTHADSILFDGVYSLIAFSMALLTLKVARLVERPDDDVFHFGYAAIEPTLNLFKSLIIIATCVYAVFGAINRLLAGGNPARYDLASIYGLLATVGCLLVSWEMFRRSRKYHSDLVRVDAKTWLVDGMLSGAILLGFIAAWLLVRSPWPEWAPIVDPVILIILGLSALPIPLKVMWHSLQEVIHKAPDVEIVENIEQQLKTSLKEVAYESLEVRVSKRGRGLYLLAHIIVADEFNIDSVEDLDHIRGHSHAMLEALYPHITVDLVFVKNPEFAL